MEWSSGQSYYKMMMEAHVSYGSLLVQAASVEAKLAIVFQE